MNGHSKIRNKGIANIFGQMGLVEAWGSGIKRIFHAAREYGLPEPKVQEFDNMFRVELFRNSFNAEQQVPSVGETSEKRRRNVGETSEKKQKIELNETQKKIIEILSYNVHLTAKKLAVELEIDSRNVERNIKRLREAGILIRHGSPKSGYWEVNLKDNE